MDPGEGNRLGSDRPPLGHRANQPRQQHPAKGELLDHRSQDPNRKQDEQRLEDGVRALGDGDHLLLGRPFGEQQLYQRRSDDGRCKLEKGACRKAPPVPETELKAEVGGKAPGADLLRQIGQHQQTTCRLSQEGEHEGDQGEVLPIDQHDTDRCDQRSNETTSEHRQHVGDAPLNVLEVVGHSLLDDASLSNAIARYAAECDKPAARPRT